MVRKEDKIKIKIHSNWKLLIVIIALIILLFVLIYFIAREDSQTINFRECESNDECVPVSCCHPNSCVPVNKTPSCKGIFCTEECSGPLDCNAGHCECTKGKCNVVSDR
ncbi:MAG: hypothetical protein WC979_04015 [Candidatus Pacearchaeota archaeon]|jgi:hypothetical protein